MQAVNGFSVQFLGSGNTWSKPPINYNNNILVESGGKRWLVDCGTLCPLALHDRGIALSKIDGVFVTHLHGDHINGLEELIYFNYFMLNRRRITLFCPEMLFTEHSGIEGEDLWDNCLRGTFEFTKDDGVERTNLLDFVNLEKLKQGEVFYLGDLKARCFSVDHIPHKPCFGISFDDRVFFTSDCVFSREKIESYLEAGAEIIFHDSNFDAWYPNAVHCNFKELSSLPREIAEKIVIMHYDDASSKEDFLRATDLGFRIAKCGERFSF